MKQLIKNYCWVSLVALVLMMGCTEAEPPVLDENTIDISKTGIRGLSQPEGSATKSVPPPLSDRQLAEGSGTDIGDHPVLPGDQPQIYREVTVPKSVAGKWQAVKILVLDKRDEEGNTMQTVALGSSITLGDSGITVTAQEFLPNFVMDKTSYTSLDNTLANPAVHLVIHENGQEIFKGWIFGKYPNLYAFQHDRFALQLMDFIPAPVS